MIDAAAPKRRIGVLGGMGPEATVQFMARLIALTPARDDRDHVPLIVDDNTQVPSRIKALIDGTGEDPAPVLADMARRLAVAGAEALAMPCNTAHHYAPAIEAAVDIPLLNMIDLTVDRVATTAPAVKRAGLLASPALQATGIFDRAFAKRDIATLYASDSERLLAAIRAIKVDSTDRSAAEALRDAAAALAADGADILIVACSEFSIIADRLDGPVAVIDSVDVLAQAVIAFAGARQNGTDDGHWRMSA